MKNIEGRKIELDNIEYDQDESSHVAAGYIYRNLYAESIEQLEKYHERLKPTISETVEINTELSRNSKVLGSTT